LHASFGQPTGTRDRAAFVLRKLESAGWHTAEIYSDYKQFVILNNYVIRILEIQDKTR
jgi:hypothetical protein